MADLNLKKGFEVKLEGEATREIVNAPKPSIVAVKPTDIKGIVFRPTVAPGDEVKVGSSIGHAKSDEEWFFSSPVSGKVKDIVRGAKRKILAVEIETDQNDSFEYEEFEKWQADQIPSLNAQDIVAHLKKVGLLHLFRQRPFDLVANPEQLPRDIFISTLDTAPLSADPNLIIQGNESFFQIGLDICNQLTSGKVHVQVDGKRKDVSEVFAHARNVQINRVIGSHPAGNIGVHIHHIAPISGREDVVWYINVQGLVTLGKLFVTGQFDSEMIVAVAGTAAKDRRYYRTVRGAQIQSFVQTDDTVTPRIISGNVLTGEKVEAEGYVGFYDNLVTVIHEKVDPEFIGWMLPGANDQSYFKAFLSSAFPGKKFDQHTGLNGGRRALVVSGIYEDVLPMDVYPIFLIKAVMSRDIDEMEQLGIYEVVEEDLAVCEYICPSKTEFQTILRQGIDYLIKEG
ncbi:MAG: Na(+)-translocating NADH-quinone reductase subunit A [Lentisphaeria bacterium]|nr:Na(+)-translocating NADH-quinone reductase subunit A [Lentisphaeria bacterium]